MRIGISLTSAYTVKDPREGARRMIDRARAAREAGLDSLFVGDHHATPVPYYQNTAILGRLLAEWGDAPCGALYLLPLWHPVLLAEQVGTLASIARGRFILQCAIGPADAQFAAFGVDPKQRPSRFEESLALMRRLWAGESVDSDGRWTLRGARVSPCPPEPVEVWIGAMANPAIERAARLGDGWLASPHLTPEGAARALEQYTRACARAGRECGVAAIRRDIYVGESDAEAARTAGAVLAQGYRGFPEDALVVGGPEHVAEQFAALRDLGYDEVVVRNVVSDPEPAVSSIRRLHRVRELLAD